MLPIKATMQSIFIIPFHKVNNCIHPNFELIFGKNYTNVSKVHINFVKDIKLFFFLALIFQVNKFCFLLLKYASNLSYTSTHKPD
jgi:hypothetical protein